MFLKNNWAAPDGKTIGGDIMEGKKTYLLLKALETVNGRNRSFLQSLAPRNGIMKTTVRRVQEIYRREGVLDSTRNEIIRNTRLAQRSLASLTSDRSKEMLLWLSDQLLERNS